MYTFSFEKLEVWKEAKDLAKSIYLTTSAFPDSEKFGLIPQLRRASVSVCSNIAEGTARRSYKDQAHFSTMAFSSLLEVMNQLILCYEMNFIREEEYLRFRSYIESTSNKLNALRNFQLKQS